jgi:hypothetical protein
MAIENVSGTGESVSKQERISVTRENDGSTSISIFADAGATAGADSESSTQTATGAEQAKSDVESTDTSYPADQPGVGDNTAGTHDESVMTEMEDLLATIDAAIELLDGQSGDSTTGELQYMGGKAPVDASPTVPAGSGDRDFADKLEGVVADLEETINDTAGSDNSELAEFLEGVFADVGGNLGSLKPRVDDEAPPEKLRFGNHQC